MAHVLTRWVAGGFALLLVAATASGCGSRLHVTDMAEVQRMRARWTAERPPRYRMLVRSWESRFVEVIVGPSGIERFTLLDSGDRKIEGQQLGILGCYEDTFTVDGVFQTAIDLLTDLEEGDVERARARAEFDPQWGFMRKASFEECHGRGCDREWEPE